MHALAGEDDGAEGGSEVVDVDDVDILDLGDFAEVDVVGEDSAVEFLGEDEQFVIDLGGFGIIAQSVVGNDDFDLFVFLQLVEDVEAATASGAFEFIGEVGEGLQFLQDEARDDQAAFEDAGFGDIQNPAVDDDGGVDEERAGAAGFALEFDVGDDEAEVVFGLHDEADGEVAAGHADEEIGELDDRVAVLLEDLVVVGGGVEAGEVLVDEELDDEAEDPGEEEADEDAQGGAGKDQ